MKRDHRLWPIGLAFTLALTACGSHDQESDLQATNVFAGKRLDYYYQSFSMTDDVSTDSFQAYILANDLLAADANERLLPKELQGLFYLDGATFPDKTLSLKHVKALDQDAQRLRWTVPYKTTFGWINNSKAHHTYAKALSHNIEYELEWRDCTNEVMRDMETQFAKFKVEEQPKRCTAADRRFAVIQGFAWYEGERIAIPENLLYFDMYLIPKNDQRDYYIWHRRSKLCNNNENSNFKQLCNIFRNVTGRNQGDGYQRYQFTQVISPEGRRTSKYNEGLLPEVIASGGTTDNIFLTCDPGLVNGDDSCLDGTEMLPPISERPFEVLEEEDRELSFFEQVVRTRKIGQYMVKVSLDLLELMMDGKSDKD